MKSILPELFCKVGDILLVKVEFAVRSDDDEGIIEIKKGAIYKAVNLVEYGWDLELIKGIGAKIIRVMNSRMPIYFEIVEDKKLKEKV